MSIQNMISCIFLILAAMYVFNWLGGILVSLFRMVIGKPAIKACIPFLWDCFWHLYM